MNRDLQKNLVVPIVRPVVSAYNLNKSLINHYKFMYKQKKLHMSALQDQSLKVKKNKDTERFELAFKSCQNKIYFNTHTSEWPFI